MVITPKYFFKMKNNNQQIIKLNWGKTSWEVFFFRANRNQIVNVQYIGKIETWFKWKSLAWTQRY
jgi:hypothetical protein